jgi:hypothetical protein
MLSAVIATVILGTTQTASATDVTIPNTFTAGTAAVAAQVNANFTAVKTAVDDNNTRIGTLEGLNAGTRLTTLEGVNAASRLTTLETTVTGGNVVLVPSTAATGNILKGANRFLHNYGTRNTFLGEGAGNFTLTTLTGVDNTASGYAALQSNTDGYNNTASGANALQSNLGGHSNTASGRNALVSNTTGNYNTASGTAALFTNADGQFNTATGGRALEANTTGSNNTALGYLAGSNLTTGNNNIAIDNLGVAAESDTIRLGDTQTRAFIAGIRDVITATAAIPVLIGTDGQLGTASSSRRVKDDIADMGKASNVLMQLRPVTFHYKSDQNPKGRTLQYGLIAEEVAQVAPTLVARTANGEIETVFYQHLAPMLLNEYQKQQRTIEQQAALLGQQTARIAQLEQQAQELAELKAQMARVSAAVSRLQPLQRVAKTGVDSQ